MLSASDPSAVTVDEFGRQVVSVVLVDVVAAEPTVHQVFAAVQFVAVAVAAAIVNDTVVVAIEDLFGL